MLAAPSKGFFAQPEPRQRGTYWCEPEPWSRQGEQARGGQSQLTSMLSNNDIVILKTM